MAIRRARIRLDKGELTLSRVTTSQPTLVYVLSTNKSLKYKYGRSRIAYISTTKRGLKRIAESVADKADSMLYRHGITKLTANFISCRGRRGARLWRKLERALIISFRERYGEVPRYNKHGKGWQWDDEGNYFSLIALRSMIEQGE